MAEEEIKEQEESAAVEKDSKKNLPFLKWIIMALVIVILGAAGLGGWWYYKTHFSEPPKEEAEQTVPIKKGIWPIDSIIVNLMDNNGERYLKITIQLEISNEDCVPELDSLKPEIMDSLLDLLSSKVYKEIVGFEGKQRLRDEIAIRLNNYLSKGQITKVYFTEFIIQ
ncbi:MAG: flagellar basal body-associated FliL family protein [Deltaproteobacteria bacterium]|nr:flagellar basal body-associated FliL family protein [Deltaproteobacteria bacterium]MBW1718199.1 flagellar basal body-associated FliL family protein [Deltaproteobacteria bacterium]MBW1938167.1 flagellar basal body-associated FliL family protein [Deltaproteobacteria bacterium]